MNRLENVIVYQSALLESNELIEHFHNFGYEPMLVDKHVALLTAINSKSYTKVFIEISNFSDIMLINSIRQISSDANIVLIVKPSLKDIIGVLQDNNYQIISSIMNVSISEGNK
jgi:hypothetical protein